MEVIIFYPSIDTNVAIKKCVEIICNGAVEFRELSTRELGLYLRLSYDNDYLDDHNSSKIYPTRSDRGKITQHYRSNEKYRMTPEWTVPSQDPENKTR